MVTCPCEGNFVYLTYRHGVATDLSLPFSRWNLKDSFVYLLDWLFSAQNWLMKRKRFYWNYWKKWLLVSEVEHYPYVVVLKYIYIVTSRSWKKYLKVREYEWRKCGLMGNCSFVIYPIKPRWHFQWFYFQVRRQKPRLSWLFVWKPWRGLLISQCS